MCVAATPQIPCVFLSKMRLGFNVIVNLHVMRPTVLGFLIFFQGKRASQEGFPEVTGLLQMFIRAQARKKAKC